MEDLLKQIVAFFILLAVASQTFSKAFIVFDYLGNTQTYEKKCENKDKPQMHCKGKCQMMKKLQQEEKKDEQNPDRKGDQKNEFVISLVYSLPCSPAFNSKQVSNFFARNCGKEIKIPRSVFRPPIC